MKSRKKYIFWAFFLPTLIQCVVYAVLGFYPFGGKSILVWDMDWQYVSFFSWLSRTIKENTIDSLFYSFSISFGSSTLGLLGYYLLSPFNIILLFVDTASLPVGIFIVTILKLSSCGLTMYLYLSEYFSEEDNKDILLFSTSYALMGYNITQQQNIMWLDAVILLPLIALGIYRFVRKNKAGMFALLLALSIIINFYTGYMLCLFSGIYLLIEILLSKEKFEIREILVKYIIGLGYIVLGVSMSAISLMPVCYEISGSRMQGASFTDTISILFYKDERMWELINKLFLGTYNVHQLKDGLPNIYTGCLCIILFTLYFLESKRKVKEKIIYGIACGIFLCSMIFLGINNIWHGFSKALGSPYRYTFQLSFLIISIACRQFINEKNESAHYETQIRKYRYAFCCVMLTGLFYKACIQYNKDNSDYLSIFQVVLTVFFCLMWIFFLKVRKNSSIYIMFLILSLELGINMGMNINNFDYADYDEYSVYVQKAESSIKQIYSEETEVIYRIENDIRYGDRRCYNDAMLLGYPSVTHYSSIMPCTVSAYASTIGMSKKPGDLQTIYQKDSVDIQTAGECGIKYLITENLPKYMAGWEIISKDPYYVLKNNYYHPIIRLEKENEENNAEIGQVSNAKIEVKIQNGENAEQKLFIMIPYHMGWNMKLDGEIITADKYQSTMMVLSIQPGEHILIMNFIPPYLKEGIIITLIAVAVLLIVEIVKQRKNCGEICH